MSVVRRLSALVAAAVGAGVLSLAPGAPASAAADDGTTSTPPAAPARAERAERAAPHDPATYYAGTAGLTGADLASVLNEIIDGHTTVNYDTVFTAMDVTDRDPNNSAAVIDFYSGTSVLASNKCRSSCPSGSWNREHTWPQSHGEFGTGNGIGTDLHHMRPEFATTNSSRGNLDFDETVNSGNPVPLCAVCQRDNDSFEPRDAVKGDLARGLFYMAVRYDGEADDGSALNLKMNDRTCNGSGAPNMGKLSTLVSWSLADPPDAAERARNDLVDGTYQGNRNPFVDHPEWVTAIYGNGVGLGPSCGGTSGSDTLPGGSTPPANNPPSTSPVTTSTPEDTAKSVTLTATDPDGDPLTWSISSVASHGTASLSGATLTYAPSPNFNGTDQVGVTVSDGRGGTAATTVTITVSAVNDPPVAGDLTASTPRGTATRIVLSATDVDDADLDYTIVAEPANGTAALANGAVTYTPRAGFTGSDTFTYRARDPQGALSDVATVRITVTAPAQQPPMPTNVTVATDEDQAVTFTLPASDPDGDPLTYGLVNAPLDGLVTLTGNQATYTPRANFDGSDSFTWSVSDGTSTVTASATVTVRPVNDPPVAVAATPTTPEDTAVTFTLGGTDVDGDTLTVALAGQPAHGSVTLTGSQARYVPAANFHGTDSFGFTVSDGTATAPGTATVTVASVNDAPTAGDVTGVRTDEVAEEGTGGVTIPLAGADVDGDQLTYALLDGPDHGTVAVAGATATYTPSERFHGTDSFTYTASDGELTSAPATVSVTVDPVNHAPTVTGPTSALRVVAGESVTATLTGTDPDAGDSVAISSVVQPSDGEVTFAGMQVTYTPDSRFSTEGFLVTVSDGRGGTASVQLGVDVSPRTARLAIATPRAVRGTRVTTSVTLTPAGRTGVVTLSSGATELGRADLGSDGTARVSWVPGRAGTASLKASWAGDDLYGRATVSRLVAVQKSAPRLTLAADGPLRRGKPGVVEVSVAKVAGSHATGTVALTIGGKRLTAKLAQGTARFRVAKLPSTATTKTAARYTGDSQYAAATTTRTFTLRT